MRPTGWVLDEPDNQGHRISVEPDGNKGTRINWGCTSHYFADPADMVANMERVENYPDVWLTLRTTADAARYVRIEGGRLYADQDNPSDRAVSCEYHDFKAALLAAANSNKEEGKG